MNRKEDSSKIVSEGQQKQSERKHFVIKLTLLVLLVIVVIGLGTGGAYYWQHSKLTSSDNKIGTLIRTNLQLQSELSTSKSSYKNLESKYRSDQTQIANAIATEQAPVPAPGPTQSDLELTIDQVEWMNPAGQVTAGAPWFGIRMTLTNSTNSSISVSPNDFQLEDADNNYYQEEGMQNGDTFPVGWGVNTMQTQTLTPGQTIVGDIIFPMPNKDITTFTLLNGTKQYTVTASNS